MARFLRLATAASLILAVSSAPSSLAHLRRATVAPPTVLPAKWTYTGCFTDTTASRTLGGKSYADSKNMDAASCIAYCQQNNYVYAGTEYTAECYCANTIGAESTIQDQTACNMGCAADSSEACGGANEISIYYANKPAPLGPYTNPGVDSFVYQGCYTEGNGGRTLPTTPNTPGGGADLTVKLCVDACNSGGYSLAGVEYAGECYCGNYLHSGGALATTQGDCNMPCNGNATEFCGAGNRLDVYSLNNVAPSSTATAALVIAPPNGWSSLGCYNDSVGSRALSQQQFLNTYTAESCTAACLAAGYTLAGSEYADECYCDNNLENHATTISSSSCNMNCRDNSQETCGGPDALTLYEYIASGPSSTSKATSISSPTPTPSTSASAAGISPYVYQGCYTDGNTAGRALMFQQPDDSTMTVESCIAICHGLKYTIAGMEYSDQCFCDNFLRYSSSLAADSQCNMPCAGNSAEDCGAGDYLSTYSIGDITVATLPVEQTTDLPGNWQYQGCISDSGANRILPYAITSFTANNSATTCLSQCSEFGYGAGGMEYSSECYCGDAEDVLKSTSTPLPADSCNMLCSQDENSNGGYICGGSNAMSYYTWQGTPLSSWKVATGNDAGAYEFLIGGVVIPLVTAPARNGKVTYLEKFGSEPTHNSTGAYELDLAQLDNFAAAWRPMHVKTDVFCSASITLPDKVGRQINVGGWTLDSTFGVRLYWPDGSPGVWGTNDWEENVNEVHLGAGRWYPSAMMMANGSILVVGGENGPNGPPVPSLELLPSPSGEILYCDYLKRTDPYNLYPYLAVLPSGGILIAYYNEARILDPVSLQTTTVLPNMPGAVNDFLGGRTYPFEGTAVLMPQYAPYSDPLTVLICGGSTPGPEIGLDNCISIQPDTPGSDWTIERMPSKRVMSCITSLPDGTFLILNGAQQGVAGFALATDPNYNAVLYDPTLPVGARMTVMASTIVARLYHSEAVLLDDGRVLVSGSDPEDTRPFAPQEYRNEVFVPPYILNGAPRPAYTLGGTGSNNDWGYGQTIEFTITTPTTGPYQISLMGAVGSTHGNSMGQRILFPTTSCSGTSCTVVAPPDANTSPPGWFQVFLLDADKIPSTASWVRIGGDPANLGSWPNYPDFTVPGPGGVEKLTNGVY